VYEHDVFSTVIRTLGAYLRNENPADAKPKAIFGFLREIALPAFLQKEVRLCALSLKFLLQNLPKAIGCPFFFVSLV
jgi:hypothetical protein